jgi:hypothetical protein
MQAPAQAQVDCTSIRRCNGGSTKAQSRKHVVIVFW